MWMFSCFLKRKEEIHKEKNGGETLNTKPEGNRPFANPCPNFILTIRLSFSFPLCCPPTSWYLSLRIEPLFPCRPFVMPLHWAHKGPFQKLRQHTCLVLTSCLLSHLTSWSTEHYRSLPLQTPYKNPSQCPFGQRFQTQENPLCEQETDLRTFN